jgi:ubiquinone/menaquinone biosynthesis C-methylase UbiE
MIEHQQLVNKYFQTSARCWEAIYERQDIHAAIYQDRRTLVLSLVSDLQLPRHSMVLEVGCGAGHTAVSLAERYMVEAVDTVQEMLDLTRKRAIGAGVENRLKIQHTNGNDLAYAGNSFDLVVAIGVLPWARDASLLLREFARVVRPGGYLIASVDNGWALQRILDPQLNPAIRPVKQALRNYLWRVGIVDPQARQQLCRNRKFDRLLTSVGLTKVCGKTLGFGPFSLFSHTILPDSISVRIHRALQQMVDREWPLIRSAGTNYIVVSRKEL